MSNLLRYSIAVAVLAGGGAAFGGVLLVAVPEPELPDGSRRHVALTVANLGDVTRRGTPVWIPSGGDGTGPARHELPMIAVASGGTVVVEFPDLDGGLLELTTAPQLILRAELILRNPEGTEVNRAYLPITEGETVLPAAETVRWLGLVRGGGRFTDIVVVNVDDEDDNLCAVELRSSQGVPISFRQVPLARRTALTLTDILAGSSGSEVHALISCAGAWTAVPVITDLARLAHRALEPVALGSSTLQIPSAVAASTESLVGDPAP